MNKNIIIFCVAILAMLLSPFANIAKAESSLAARLAGKILLQVESYGRAWYVNPDNYQRYYLRDGSEAYEVMRNFGLGITNQDLAKIPDKTWHQGDSKLVERLKGKILLQVEENGEAWYVNPDDGIRYYMANGQAAYEIMREFALGISNDDLSKIEMNTTQIAHDTTFNDVAYVGYNGVGYFGGYNDGIILPLASMTKIMTALVLLDLEIDWDEEIEFSQSAIEYPFSLVGEGEATSEIDCAVGDKATFYDIWVSMLVASSNQSAVALVESTGLSQKEFVNLMNNKAKGLGLEKTLFFDVTGLDAHNVTTPKEMAIIANEAFSKPDISNMSKLGEYIVRATTRDDKIKNIKVADRNYSLQKYNHDGVKTGYLIEAQRTVSLKKGDKIIIVMHALSMAQRNSAIEALLAK